MTALHEHGARPERVDAPGRLFHGLFVLDQHPGERPRLVEVGRDHRRQGKHAVDQRLARLGPEQRVA